MVHVEIVSRPIDVERTIGVTDGSCGAVVEFQGAVRDSEEGSSITALEYECHLEMAKVHLERIAKQVAMFYSLAEFVVVHRIGVIPVGESALYVKAVAPHRREAFVATMELIERLKKDVPIWKHAVTEG